MEKVQENIESIEKDMQYFDRMVQGAEKLIRPWRWAVIALIVGWALTIGGFLWFISQYDYVSYEQDGSGYNNINAQVEGSVYNNNGPESENPQEQGGQN